MQSQPRRDERLVLGITGRIGSGKTSAGSYLSSSHGFQYLRYSLVLADWKAGDPESRAQLQRVGWDVMAGGLQRELNQHLIRRIDPGADVAIDGLRHPIDFETLSAEFSANFHLVFIDCPAELRWQRLKRKYPEWANFEAADLHPVEQNIETLRGRSAAVIRNEAALADLYAAVDRAIQQFGKGGQT